VQTEVNAWTPAGTEGPPGETVASLEAAEKRSAASPEPSFGRCCLSQPQQMLVLKAGCGAEERSHFSSVGLLLCIFV